MIDKLDAYLATLPSGPTSDTAELDVLLAACWHSFSGDYGGMEGRKLLGRMEEVVWKPPILRFTVERHGGTVLGLGRLSKSGPWTWKKGLPASSRRATDRCARCKHGWTWRRLPRRSLP